MRKLTLKEALEYGRTRTVKEERSFDYDLVIFTDGSAIRCESKWSGPLSEVTPDIDADPPEFTLIEKWEE